MPSDNTPSPTDTNSSDSHKVSALTAGPQETNLFNSLATMPTAISEQELRSLPARYQIDKRLGCGGWGQVYLARDVGETGKGSRDVAIKLVRGDLSGSQEVYERFTQEMHIAEKFDHPNIVQVLTHGKTAQGVLYLVMQYIEGGSLLDRLNQLPGGRLADFEVIELGLQMCAALMVAHDMGVIHRDIKPGNILMHEERYPRKRVVAKLADFGLARSLDASQASQSIIAGTFGYRSPEQRNGKRVDIRSDIYSLGATLYHAVSGESPEGIVDWDELPSVLRPLLRRALSKRPEDRYITAHEFYEALEQCQPKRRPSQLATPIVSIQDQAADLATPSELMNYYFVDSKSQITIPREHTPVSNTSPAKQPRFPEPEPVPTHRESKLTRVPLPETLTNSLGMQFRLIRSGTFGMGSPRSESGREDNETQHSVTISAPYYLGIYEVTQEEYKRVMGTNPSRFKGPRNPVENVSWEDAIAFIEALNAMPSEQQAGRLYRLPTEAEWEYACRSGSSGSYCFGDSVINLQKYAWFGKNSGGKTHPVGEKEPNAWGLHDMHGNVWEWCSDWYGAYPSTSVTDPSGPNGGSSRVIRGGCWCNVAANCRSADRFRLGPSNRYCSSGFRLALSSGSGIPG